jgi:hypothetical protein
LQRGALPARAYARQNEYPNNLRFHRRLRHDLSYCDFNQQFALPARLQPQRRRGDNA